MAFIGARVVLLCCFLVHFAFNFDFVLLQMGGQNYSFIFPTLAITLLLYPVIGLLADICCNRYNCIKVSIVLLLVSTLTGLGFAVTALVIVEVQPALLRTAIVSRLLGILMSAIIIMMIFSLGMFEAVGIQFGMDQMVEASSDQISAFTHWYYWSMNIGIGIQATIALCSLYVFGQCILPAKTVQSFEVWDGDDVAVMAEAIVMIVIQTVSVLASLLSLYQLKRYLTIEPAGHNPFTTVYKVLKYAWQHKCPERRSAFTYWEEDIPPHIDLGKNKYGGPFTTEEVEDVKTFLTLLLVIVSLFGFHLADNDTLSAIKLNGYYWCHCEPKHSVMGLFHSSLRTIYSKMLHRLGIQYHQELAGIVIVL